MDQIVQMIGQWAAAHPYWAVGILAGSWLVSALASTMPSPNQNSSTGYKWLFGLLHYLGGSIGRVTPFFRLPGDPSKGSTPFYAAQQSNTPPPPGTPVH